MSISAKTGQRVERVLELAVDVWGERRRDLDRRAQPALSAAAERTPPPMVRGRPPEDLLRDAGRASRRRRSCSSPRDAGSIHFSYRRYLENRLREAFGFDGTPIRLVFRERASRQAAASKKPDARAASGRGRVGRRRPLGAQAAPKRRLWPAPRVAVVGAGAWGTTLAADPRAAEPVTLLCHSPETAARIARDAAQRGAPAGHRPAADASSPTADPAALADATDLVVFAVPSAHLREMVEAVAPHLARVGGPAVGGQGHRARHAAPHDRGHRGGGGLRPARIAALSGPNLAPRSRASLPASAVVAAEDPALAERIAARLGRRAFRLYVNRDLLGVELCGALKNVVAIAAGAADGLGFGDNGKAGLHDPRPGRDDPARDRRRARTR